MATERKRVLFYGVEAFTVSNGIDWPVSLSAALEHVGTLPASDPPGAPSRYMSWKSDVLLMEVVDSSPARLRGAFAVKRTRSLPRLEVAGSWSDLRLAAGQGLAEIRHFVYWPSKDLLGIEVNGRGPGMGAFSDYVYEKCSADPHKVNRLDLAVYLAQDQFDILDAAEKVSTATIGVRRDSVSQIGDLDQHVLQSFEALAKTGNARELRVEFMLGDRRKSASLELPLFAKLKAFVSSPSGRDALTRLTARAKDSTLGESRTIDLLEDRFIGYEEVVLAPNGVVDQGAMLDAIEAAAAAIE